MSFRVKEENEIQRIMEDIYSEDAEKVRSAREELLKYGEDLLRSGEPNCFEAYQTLVRKCAGVIADKGITVNPIRREVIDDRAVEISDMPIQIELMKAFEKQAKDELGADTEHAEAVKQTREIVEKTVKVLSRQRDIMEKVGRDPSSIEGFLKAIDSNNALTREAIKVDQERLEHFKGYFPDTNEVTTINPEASTYKDSQYDKVDRFDRQVQLLEDLAKTYEELKKNEENRKKYQRQVDDGDEEAKANVESCKRKEKELREKISKKGPDGRETGILQRLKDNGIDSRFLSDLDLDTVESYDEKLRKAREVVLQEVKKDRYAAYKEMAATVIKTLEEKGVVDKTSKRYPESRKAEMIDKFRVLLGVSKDSKNEGPDFGQIEETDIDSSMADLKAYVKYVKDDIQMTTDRINESNSVIEFREETKSEVEATKADVEKAKAEAERLRREPVSEEKKQEWLDETIEVNDGRDDQGNPVTRSVVVKEEIERNARAQAEREYRNKGRNGLTKAVRNFFFAITHGFRRRDTLISERALSLEEIEKDRYIADRKRAEIRRADAEVESKRGRVNAIESLSMESRNDASLHTAAHNAAASITDLTGKTPADVERAETDTSKNLSDMGYDIALQRWRNGEISQSEFDRVLREHLATTRTQKDRYGAPDETKGYTKTPEYRNGTGRTTDEGDGR